MCSAVQPQAGASFAITQLFYDASSYTDFVAEARAAGVTIPILAGLLPTTEPARLRRVEELTGVRAPQRLLDALDALPDPEAQHAYGIAYSVDLAQRVLDAGAPGLHVYTFNKHRAALDLLQNRLAVEPTWATETYQIAIERLEKATTAIKDLPLPVADRALDAEALPLPAGAPDLPTESLPLPAMPAAAIPAHPGSLAARLRHCLRLLLPRWQGNG